MNLTQSTNSGVAISAYGTARSTVKGAPLSSDELRKIDAYGANFALFSESAEKVELCPFDSVSAKSESRRAFHYEQRRNHE